MIEVKIKKEDVNVAVKDFDIKIWHKRLGFIGEKWLETHARKGFLPSFASISLKTRVHCLIRKT